MYRPTTFSARWSPEVVARLKRQSDRTGTNRSRLAERYVEEGIRMDEHPGIVFRDGPSGRRAGLAAGPDVWELVMTLRGMPTRGEEAMAEIGELLNLSERQVRAAFRYYAAFPEEVDARVALNDEGADEAEAAWRREQAALA